MNATSERERECYPWKLRIPMKISNKINMHYRNTHGISIKDITLNFAIAANENCRKFEHESYFVAYL